jgi:hypothetical protein
MSRAMSQKKLDSSIANGCGSGRMETYQSWIRIRRRASSPVSNQYSWPNPLHTRALQLLSGLEHTTANVAVWLGVTEVREQHPAWPYPHRHPASGINPDLDRQLGTVPGLLEIAKDAGINHGVYPGTKIPFVATIDFTLGTGHWSTNRLIHWSCKPRGLLESAPNRERMKERILMEQLYSHSVGGKHVVIDGSHFNGVLAANLDALCPLRSEYLTLKDSSRFLDYGSAFMDVAHEATVSDAKEHAARLTRLDEKDRETYFRAAAWCGRIDIDMEKPIVMSRLLQIDTRMVKSKLRNELL